MSTKRSLFTSKKRTDGQSSSRTNPFDSDLDVEKEQKPARAPHAPPSNGANDQRSSLFSRDEVGGRTAFSSSARNQYKNDFRDTGGIENQSVQEMENYAVYKSEETTQKVHGCMKIAEEMRESASKSLVTIHQQGQQISRTHMMAADIDQDLTRGEKLLGDLGGIFSKKWKPKRNHAIKGPRPSRDDSFIRKGSHMEQRQKLGLMDHPPRSNPRQYRSEPTSVLEKVEAEKAKQDDALSDLSSILTQLKGMALDMGSEIERQTTALGVSEKDFDELSYRVKGASTRTRRLLGR